MSNLTKLTEKLHEVKYHSITAGMISVTAVMQLFGVATGVAVADPGYSEVVSNYAHVAEVEYALPQPISIVVPEFPESELEEKLPVVATPAPDPCPLNEDYFVDTPECNTLIREEEERIERERQEAERLEQERLAAERRAATAAASRNNNRSGVVPAPSANGNQVLEIAFSAIGTPYKWGGNTLNGFDCSGFTTWVFSQVGINLPRSSGQQRHAGTVISRSEAQPGDLIWWPGHVAIMVDPAANTMIDASRPGTTVQVRNIWREPGAIIRLG